MSDLSVVILLFASLVIFQQIYFLSQIQKLLDKAMSRSYTEYVKADKDPVRITLPQDPPEDLRILQEFNV